MNNMTRGNASYLGSEFDGFLYAPIGVEKNGMLISVLSAMARQKIDPWVEAAQLADLPKKTAIQKLMSLIAALPDWPSTHVDFEPIATRLITLLPQREFSVNPSRKSMRASEAANIYSAAMEYVFFVFILMFVLNAPWIGSAHQPIAQADSANIRPDLPVDTKTNSAPVPSPKK